MPAVLVLIGWALTRNFLNVTTTAARRAHAGVFLFVLLLFVVVLFRNFLARRRYGEERPPLIARLVNGFFTLIVGLACLALAIESPLIAEKLAELIGSVDSNCRAPQP